MKFLNYLVIFILSALVCAVAFAAEAEAVPGQAVADKILLFLGSLEGKTFIIAGAVDMALRLVKSQKPLSLAYVVVGVLKMVANVLQKVAELLDKVLPQRVK